MTKFNWEKANKRERQNNFLFLFDVLDEIKIPNQIEFNLSNPIHNSLNLSDDDCRGRMPSELNRKLILKLLTAAPEIKFIECDSINLRETISAKDFYEFSWKLFKSDFEWSTSKLPIQYLLPIAVCFSVVYLKIYNTVISPQAKAKQLTLEILESMQTHLKTKD